MTIDLRVVVEYGLNLAEVASTIRNRVSYEVGAADGASSSGGRSAHRRCAEDCVNLNGDLEAVQKVVGSALASLEANRSRIDDLNVYPGARRRHGHEPDDDRARARGGRRQHLRGEQRVARARRRARCAHGRTRKLRRDPLPDRPRRHRRARRGARPADRRGARRRSRCAERATPRTAQCAGPSRERCSR